MEFTAFKNVASSVSHAHCHRIQWARMLRLEYTLACCLQAGYLFNELAGIQDMVENETKLEEVAMVILRAQSRTLLE